MKDKRPRVVFIHSLNNYSGSPKVLAGVIRAFSPNDFRLELFTSRGEGFLSHIVGVRTIDNGYRWTNNKWSTLFFLIVSQCYGFIRVCLYSKKNTVFYINTIIPFGSILACRLTRKKMIVHIHENMNTAKPLYMFCKKVVQICVRDSIFVSKYLSEVSQVKGSHHVIYNGIELPEKSTIEAKSCENNRKVILMVASLRVEKGIYLFAEIARSRPQYDFEIVLSATEDQVYKYICEVGYIVNLRVFPLQKDMAPYYNRATILLQLSQPAKIVETYGMTIIEAMAFGVPSIVPNVGGPKEIVDQTGCGVSCNTGQKEDVLQCIEQLLSDKKAYEMLSQKCLEQVKEFTLNQMQKKISTIVYEKFNS